MRWLLVEVFIIFLHAQSSSCYALVTISCITSSYSPLVAVYIVWGRIASSSLFLRATYLFLSSSSGNLVNQLAFSVHLTRTSNNGTEVACTAKFPFFFYMTHYFLIVIA